MKRLFQLHAIFSRVWPNDIGVLDYCACILAADADDAANVHPLFRCDVSLDIPLMTIGPTPDEVQAAVVQAAQRILATLKSVVHWSITYGKASDAEHRPTTPGIVTGMRCITVAYIG